MAKWLNPNVKQYVAGISLVILAAVNITAPINLRDMIPAGVTQYITWVAYAGIAGAYWIFTSETA